MSVIVEDAGGRLFLITKGAESTVIPKCISSSPADLIINASTAHVNDFAKVNG